MREQQTTVVPWVHTVDLDPGTWPDAESFIPERWLGEYKGVQAHRKDLLVFSAGSRSCLGEQ
jgi:cytochrome P450